MRTPAFALALLIGAATVAPAPALAETRVVAGADRVTIEFVGADRFVDARGDCSSGPGADVAVLEALTGFIRAEAEPLLPAGFTLAVTVTGLDRAGEVDRRVGPPACHPRLMSDAAPPRIDLRFALLDAQGKRAREGVRQLRDSNYLARETWRGQDPLRFEKAVLREWLRAELRGLSRS